MKKSFIFSNKLINFQKKVASEPNYRPYLPNDYKGNLVIIHNENNFDFQKYISIQNILIEKICINGWKAEPSARPTFDNILDIFESIKKLF